jgi:hypothetical protein
MSMKIFWLIWVLTVILLLLTLIEYEIFDIIIYLALFALVGSLAYSLNSNKKSLRKIIGIVEKIDLTPLEEGVKKIERSQRECYLRLFKLENELEERRLEQERKYRDVVRKVIEIDNELNTKFRLLGEVILKLSKEKKSD